MKPFENPALTAFVAHCSGGRPVAEVFIRPDGESFELRHIADRDAASPGLETVAAAKARAVAQFTAGGEFRPLKSAPTLRRGWRIVARGATELGLALDGLYPGAVADWFASRAPLPPVTSWREMTARQGGMYRITTMLDDGQAAALIAETCAPARCLKRRLWSAAQAGPDAESGKSLIPCLEPCALLLEAARRAVRAGQETDRERASES